MAFGSSAGNATVPAVPPHEDPVSPEAFRTLMWSAAAAWSTRSVAFRAAGAIWFSHDAQLLEITVSWSAIMALNTSANESDCGASYTTTWAPGAMLRTASTSSRTSCSVGTDSGPGLPSWSTLTFPSRPGSAPASVR